MGVAERQIMQDIDGGDWGIEKRHFFYKPIGGLGLV